jgi:hypothetical protein
MHLALSVIDFDPVSYSWVLPMPSIEDLALVGVLIFCACLFYWGMRREFFS